MRDMSIVTSFLLLTYLHASIIEVDPILHQNSMSVNSQKYIKKGLESSRRGNLQPHSFNSRRYILCLQVCLKMLTMLAKSKAMSRLYLKRYKTMLSNKHHLLFPKNHLKHQSLNQIINITCLLMI